MVFGGAWSLDIFMPSQPVTVGKGDVFGMFVCSPGQIWLPWYLMKSLNSFDKTDREYSLAPTDDLIRWWTSVVKVAAGSLGQI